jgi:predicted enzyme related to lactoylglutathione lyase
MKLAWIAVHDLKKAIQFYTDVVGLEVKELSEQFGWAELEGSEGGARVGLAQMPATSKEKEDVQPGQNAILTFTVPNLEKAIEDLTNKKTTLIGDIQEIPGCVKLQMASDSDGNRFQLVELLKHTCSKC